jgi:uncharacterized protein (DUF58 family)
MNFKAAFIVFLFLVTLAVGLLFLSLELIALCIFIFLIIVADYSINLKHFDISIERKIVDPVKKRYYMGEDIEISTKILLKQFKGHIIEVIEPLDSRLMKDGVKIIENNGGFDEKSLNDSADDSLLKVEIDNEYSEIHSFFYLKNSRKKLEKFNKNKSLKNNRYNFKENNKKSVIFKYNYTINIKRGYYEFDPVEVRFYGIFNIFYRTIFVKSPLQLVVYPEEPGLFTLPMRSRKFLIYSGVIPSKRAGTGTDFFDIKEYSQGDKLSSINWKHNAKFTDSLFVNTFEQQNNTDISIILDTRSSAYDFRYKEEILDSAINAAYSIAKFGIFTQNRVSFFRFGSFFQYVPPAYGKFQLEKIASVLAYTQVSDISDFWELDALPKELLPPSSLIFLITPLCEEDLPHILKFIKKKFHMIIIGLDVALYEYLMISEEEKKVLLKAHLLEETRRKYLLKAVNRTYAQVLNWDCITNFTSIIKQNRDLFINMIKRY